MFSYIQYFPLTHTYGMMRAVKEINKNDYDSFLETAHLCNDCIVFIIDDDWRRCDLNEYTKSLINI